MDSKQRPRPDTGSVTITEQTSAAPDYKEDFERRHKHLVPMDTSSGSKGRAATQTAEEKPAGSNERGASQPAKSNPAGTSRTYQGNKATGSGKQANGDILRPHDTPAASVEYRENTVDDHAKQLNGDSWNPHILS